MRSGFAVVVMASVLALVGCKKEQPEQGATKSGDQVVSGTVKVDGSSTVFPITEAVAEEFQKANNEVRVTVGIAGTGGGLQKFCNGEVDVANASRPIKPSEVELCKKGGIEFVELPIAYDGIAILVNPQNDWANTLTTDELKKIWAPEAQNTVMKWSQVRQGWPDAELHLFGAGVDSGTYDYFTEAIVKKEHSSRGDYTSSEDDNVVVQGIANDKNGLGFIGYAYYLENKDKLKVVPVDDGKADNGAGPIAPSVETVKNGTYQPLSRPVFIYVSTKALEKPQVRAFTQFYLVHAEELVKEVGYIPLPPKAYVLAQERVEDRVTGSLFGGKGSQVGVSIEDLLAKQGPEVQK